MQLGIDAEIQHERAYQSVIVDTGLVFNPALTMLEGHLYLRDADI
jgi:hypothetical protein